MEFEKKEIVFDSSNGIYKVHGKLLKPIGIDLKGVIQISHGMSEYIDKYDDFAEYMLKKGFAVVGHDHIGHGNSINELEDRGYFGSKDGYKCMIEDLKTVTDIAKKEIPNVPYFLLGHSMGSLIARCYAAKYGRELNGLILCGTVGPHKLINAGIKLVNYMIDKKDERYRSKKIYDLSLNFANIKIESARTKFDWVTCDEGEIDKHIKDPNGSFIFTLRGFSDLFHLVSLANSRMLVKTVPKRLPIIFMSGDNDPIGEYGAGVERAYNIYKSSGLSNVRIKLYEGKRHALLKEVDKEQVFKYILNWISSQI